MRENLDVFDFTLTDDEMARIATLDTGASAASDPCHPARVAFLSNIRFDT
jgi:2,5-diketo-D-gluconate reductase A